METMDIKLNTNPISEKVVFKDGIKRGLYALLIEGLVRGHVWLSDEEVIILRECHDIGLISYD